MQPHVYTHITNIIKRKFFFILTFSISAYKLPFEAKSKNTSQENKY